MLGGLDPDFIEALEQHQSEKLPPRVAERIDELSEEDTLAIGAPLVSHDISEFSRVDGLPLVDRAA